MRGAGCPASLGGHRIALEVPLHDAIRARLNEIDGIDRAIIATEPEGRVVHWNAAAERLYEWTSREALGRNIVELTPAELSRGEATDIMSVLAAGEPWSGEFLVRTKSGARFTAHVVDIPVLDDGGTLVHHRPFAQVRVSPEPAGHLEGERLMTHMHALSDGDREFVRAFEEHEIPPAEFSHRAHVRLAYAYLVGSSAAEASAAMRATLLTFLSHHGIDPGKYHETLTRSWILAVRHFMERSAPAGSADEFIAANPALLDTGIMLTHYRATTLFSEEARARFVLPDLDAIPNQDG